MSATISKSREKGYSKSALEAGDRLLKAVKEKILREKGVIDFDDLRRKGYSEATLARLKEI
jgi:hypothetical protein